MTHLLNPATGNETTLPNGAGTEKKRCRRHRWTPLFTDTDKIGVANDPRKTEPTPTRYTFEQWHGKDYQTGYFNMYAKNQYRLCAECDCIGLHFPVSGRTVRADSHMPRETAETARESAKRWQQMVKGDEAVGVEPHA